MVRTSEYERLAVEWATISSSLPFVVHPAASGVATRYIGTNQDPAAATRALQSAICTSMRGAYFGGDEITPV